MKLTRRESMVLRFIFEALGKTPIVGVKQVAEFLGVSLPSAHELLSRLTKEKGLLMRVERKGYTLSKHGEAVARKIVAAHRVLEVVFHVVFGMDADNACNMATYVDYLISQEYVINAFKHLGCPECCPHNKRIPIGGDSCE